MKRFLLVVAISAVTAAPFAGGAARAEDIKLRIASGHPPANTYVNLMQNFFVPEVVKRVAARTKHKVEFIEGYGGAMVKVADTLEGVQSGIIDIGGYCFCFEPAGGEQRTAGQELQELATASGLIGKRCHGEPSLKSNVPAPQLFRLE